MTETTDAPVTHMTASTQFVDVAGMRVAFRRFGAAGATVLVMLQHFRGNLDNWDPALTGFLTALDLSYDAIVEWGIPDHGAR
jgi:hypothetical protein